MKKNLNYYKLISVFTLTTLIFIAGILLGHYLTNKKIEALQNIEKTIRTDIEATELQYILATENPCSADTDFITKELEELGSKLTYMENMLGFDNKDVLDLRNYYSLIQIKHYILMKKINKDCKQNFNFIIYFYSNKGDCPKCEQQGFILDYIKKKYPYTMIYAFDINNNNPALVTFKRTYKVSKTPALVINDKTFEKFMALEEIEELIK